jgi:hypothetical protein
MHIALMHIARGRLPRRKRSAKKSQKSARSPSAWRIGEHEKEKHRKEPPEVALSRALGFLIAPRRVPYYAPRHATRHGS